MELSCDSQINKSTAKSNFRFSKDDRFKLVKIVNHTVAYSPKTSDFDRVKKQSGEGTRFGGSMKRFDYYANRRKEGKSPSAADYNSCELMTKKGNRFSRQSFAINGCNFG